MARCCLINDSVCECMFPVDLKKLSSLITECHSHHVLMWGLSGALFFVSSPQMMICYFWLCSTVEKILFTGPEHGNRCVSTYHCCSDWYVFRLWEAVVSAEFIHVLYWVDYSCIISFLLFTSIVYFIYCHILKDESDFRLVAKLAGAWVLTETGRQ